jgi:hypothetical protein
MNHLKHVVSILAIALVSGCAAVPEYRVPQGTETARLNLKSNASKWVCVAGQRLKLVADSTGYADIPAGNRLTIGSNYYNYVYGGVSTSCNPRSSIIPEAGQRYYIDFEIEAERCYAFIFREGAKNRTGLAFEPTVGPSTDCFGR